jgi:hypothetical protein
MFPSAYASQEGIGQNRSEMKQVANFVIAGAAIGLWYRSILKQSYLKATS